MTATATDPATAPPVAPQAPAPVADDSAFWDAEPGTEIPRPPLFVVLIAEPGLGKTHVGCTFPGPVVCLDTEFRADEVLRKFRNIEKYWKKVERFDDVRQAIGRAMKKHKTPGTILFDSGSDLQLMAEAEVLAEIAANEKKAHKTLHWGPVNARFKNLFGFLRDKRWNCVFTARLKEEWKGDDRTGNRVPGGFVTDKLIYHADFALRLEKRDTAPGGRVAIVLKNGAKKVGTYANELPDSEINFAGIMKAMEAEPEKVIVPASASGLKPAASAAASAPAPTAPTAPTPIANTTPARLPVPPTEAASVVSSGGAQGAPTSPAAAPSTPPVDSPGAAILGESFLNSLGFFKTGRIIEEIGLDRASRVAAEWAEARDRKHAAEMVTHEHALTRSGWYRRASEAPSALAPAPEAPAPKAPKKEAKAEAVAAQEAVAASASPPAPATAPASPAAPDPALASPEEVAELLALAASLNATPDQFWARVKAKGWSSEPGKIAKDKAKLAKDTFMQAKAAREKASAGATAQGASTGKAA
jgi:hypothetical protein